MNTASRRRWREIQERAAGLIAENQKLKREKPCPGGLRGEVQEVLSSHAAAHGLAIDLASAGNKNSLNKSLELLLDAALKIEGIDGGVYTVSEESRVALLLHQGLSERFIESCSKYEPGAPRSSLVGAGEWIYWNRYGHKHSKGPDEHVLPFHLPGGHDRHQQVRRYGAGPGDIQTLSQYHGRGYLV